MFQKQTRGIRGSWKTIILFVPRSQPCFLLRFRCSLTFQFDLAVNRLDSRELIKNHTRFLKYEFIKAFSFIFKSIFFTFNNKYYRQTFGTPIGSPLSLIIADIVLQNSETLALKKLILTFILTFILIFYFKYVDDIVFTVPSSKLNELVAIFNSFLGFNSL